MKIMEDSQKRHEIKFVINENQRLNFIKKNNLKNLFPDRYVESIYYDTKDLLFFNLSEEGITPRKKVRVRGYNKGNLDNLEIKTTQNHYREKIIIKNFKIDNYELHKNLKKIGINKILEPKLRVKYLRSYFQIKGVGRITLDRYIEFFPPNLNFHNSKKISTIILEVKTSSSQIDKNSIEKIINFREIRFSKYCTGINLLFKSN